MQLDWETLREELDRSHLDVDVSPTSISGHPAVIVLAPVAPMKSCDSLRALLLAKDLDLGSIVTANDQLALRHVILASSCTLDSVVEAATLLVQNAALLRPAILSRPPRALKATNVFASTMLSTD
jgi:hypothetical protein